MAVGHGMGSGGGHRNSDFKKSVNFTLQVSVFSAFEGFNPGTRITLVQEWINANLGKGPTLGPSAERPEHFDVLLGKAEFCCLVPQLSGFPRTLWRDCLIRSHSCFAHYFYLIAPGIAGPWCPLKTQV